MESMIQPLPVLFTHAILVANQSVGNRNRGTRKDFEMGQIGTIITTATERVTGLGAALLNDIDASKAARMPEGINCNHPVFVYGHLAIYPQMIMGMLVQDAGDTKVPENYKDLFMHGVECKDDVDGKIYPSLDEVVEHCTRACATLIEYTKTADDALLVKDIEDIEGNGGFRDAFGTNAGMIMFLIHDHPMFHFGQVSTWRRAMGLGSAM